MANPMEELSEFDGQSICALISYGIYPEQYPILYGFYDGMYSKEAIDAKVNECKASHGYNKKKKDISSRERLADYRIQQSLKNKMDQFKGE